MVNRFKDKSYVHLSDISKCFQQGVGFDIKKIKSITTETKGGLIFRCPSDIDQLANLYSVILR